MSETQQRKAFITGSSRGIGAETALVFAEDGWDVALGATRESSDLRKTLRKFDKMGMSPPVVLADITRPESRQRLTDSVLEWADGELSTLILNAAGGMEAHKDASYGVLINRDAQVALTQSFSPEMTPGGTIVFVTSHWAHWYDRGLIMPPFEMGGKTYDVVAGSKHAGEIALRELIPDLTERDQRLLVTVAGYVPDTLVGRLGKRGDADYVEQQAEIDNTPDMRTVAKTILSMVNNSNLQSGATEIIGANEETFLRIAKDAQ
ncbi:MAG TPA: SDR family NAD(P)-dependent oxidoreductase [Candidatus Babeliales bacterium]|nr:SDR family NAD(P)-dependent oxidoreductase [Candidatus Babeliales bacterium]